jgi:hypothetical protein
MKRKSQGVNVKTTTNIDDNNNNKNILSLQENTINENSFDLNTTPSRIFIKEMNTDILTHKMVRFF